ncbi:MAG: cupin domain-containing protein [Candidatus Helarchaeota archaeon]
MSEIKKEKPTKEEIEKYLKEWSVWDCDPSEFDWEYDTDEIAYIIEGEVDVTNEEGKVTTIKAGDLVTFPKGMKCTWNVKKKLHKVYSFK